MTCSSSAMAGNSSKVHSSDERSSIPVRSSMWSRCITITMAPFCLSSEAGQQGIVEPIVHPLTLAVGEGIARLERIVDDDDVAAPAGQRAVDRGGKPKAVARC